MLLQLKPYPKNKYPLGGILIRSTSVNDWVLEIQRMQLSLNDIVLYPIPGNTANSIWGCMVILQHAIDKTLIGKNELCQQVTPNLYIAERSVLYPSLSIAELEKLFANEKHIFHPEFGMVELKEPLDINALIMPPEMRSYYITRPAGAVYLPVRIRSFQIAPVSPEEVEKKLEEQLFPKKEKMKDKPLSMFEKGKLLFYRKLFTKDKDKDKKEVTKKTKVWARVENYFSRFMNTGALSEKMQDDFEDLEERNKKEVDKLMDMLRNNPEEALKYAVPLDNTGRGGSNKGMFQLSKNWLDLSWLGGSSSGSGGTFEMGDKYFELQAQYMATAEALVKDKKYHNAAFVYMKLLKNPYKAAEVLEQGGYYQDAATIFLKHANNKMRAAECYEKGKMVTDAIALYDELGEYEKVGDLYTSIDKKKMADSYYQKVADSYNSRSQHVKAAQVYKNKMGRVQEAQDTLLEGWKYNKDATNCLVCYFANIEDEKQVMAEIERIHRDDVNAGNCSAFLQSIRHKFSQNNELADDIKELAYKVIAAHIDAAPSIITELKMFNPADKELMKDTLRYKTRHRR